jgi:lipid-binding SYLF domain-containing protein
MLQEREYNMKNYLLRTICLVAAFGIATAYAWDPKEVADLDTKAQTAKSQMLEKDADMERFFDAAVAYVIIPTVAKAGLGIGGARGKGLLYEGGAATGVVTLTQLSIGFQAGGQAYSEFIFFKDDVALAEFKRGNYELGAQASAVAVTAGASADANYSGGVAIFTQAKGGLMYEASVGGQKFKVELQ